VSVAFGVGCRLWRGSVLCCRFSACFIALASALSLALVPGTTLGAPTGELEETTDLGFGLGEVGEVLGEVVGLGEMGGVLGEAVGLGEVESVLGRAKAPSAPNPESRRLATRTTPRRLTCHRLP
jgi:hypothetical protein